jgi:soluble lytic murein transglycosylase-like protein
MRFLAPIFLLVVNSTFAGEFALLVSGSRLHVDRHEVEGAKVRLYNAGGSIEMDAALILGFEADESAAAVPVIPQAAAPLLSPRELADSAADKYGLPRNLVRSVMAAESGFQTRVVSPKGAVGLMQLMPQTALTLGVNPLDDAQNVDAGTRYLRDLLERYHGALYHALAAYNAGPAAVDKYKGIPPFPETVNYVSRIAADWTRAKHLPSASAQSDPASPPK